MLVTFYWDTPQQLGALKEHRHLEDCGYKGEHSLGAERKQVICNLPEPETRRQVREFLGAVGFCRLWIPNFSVLAQPPVRSDKAVRQGTL
ncbi:Gag-Pol polyprotein [Plecturocebus cupreus]